MIPAQTSIACTSTAGSLPITLLPASSGDLPSRSLRAEQTVSSASSFDRDHLITSHMSTVRFIARRIHERLPQHVELDELISAGIVGLIDAIAKFDARKQVQFKSYAQFRIRGAILDSLRQLDWSPRELRRKARSIEETVRTLTARLGHTPGEPEIADAMGLSLGAYQQLLGELKSLEIGSLNLERNEESGEEELAYIPGPSTDDPLFQCLRGEMRERLAAAIEVLPERERLVLTLYYYEELTMKEIAQVLDLVESRISQIHSSAVLHLRTALDGTKEQKPKRAARRRR